MQGPGEIVELMDQHVLAPGLDICQRAARNSQFAGQIFLLKAQLSQFKDSIIQISGITMTADSLRAIPAVSVLVRGQNRGTISNSQGVFSIVAFKGDTLTFSAVGFKRKDYKIPTNLPGNNYSMIQLLVIDTTYLPVTIIRPYPSR